jgi:inorganic pyrophosphatase
MWVASATNVRVADAAKRSAAEALVVCFRGGVFSAVLNLTLCVFGVTSLFVIIAGCGFVDDAADVPLLLVGYGFGASFVALFMQLGGGIYTKAADVGADLVGKVEASIPEDDPRNPAVIADLVGDMVGDCVGSSADVFESVGAEIIGAMILGGRLARDAKLDPAPFVFFPLIIHALDIVASSLGALSVTKARIISMERSEGGAAPMAVLQRGYMVTLVVAFVGFFFACRWLLDVPGAPNAWLHFLGCGLCGFGTAFVCMRTSRYYTDYAYEPVRRIAESATTGHATVIITGLAVGLESTVTPTLTVGAAVVAAYHLGRTAGLDGAEHPAGLFGTAVATMGMLASAVYVLSMNNFGPIADNAGGIVEMSDQAPHVRDATDALDAAGNVTKAVTKGYSIGSAALACFLLFGAFMDEFSAFAGEPFEVVDVAKPEVLVGGLFGVTAVFAFAGMAIAAVGRTAHEVVIEVRRQFAADPGILAGTSAPDYDRCVAIVTKAALDEMVKPGVLCVLAPVAVGFAGRGVGALTGRPLLGAEVLAGYLVFGTVSGILMALFLDNVGGAWDNAKKYVELGNFGGKNSDAHKAAVTGDTVGDPLKDTAGPSLHVVIKLLSTTVLVLGPLFVGGGV